MSAAHDLRDLAAWADHASRWLEAAARQTNDNDDRTRCTMSFDALTLDEFLTGFRRMPGLIEAVADRLDQRPVLSVISGGAA